MEKFILNQPQKESQNDPQENKEREIINNPDFIDLFYGLIKHKMGYDEVHLLNDIHHITKHHLNTKSDYDELSQDNECTINNQTEYCIQDLITTWRQDRNYYNKIQNENSGKYNKLFKYLSTLDPKQLTVIHTVSRIHFIINHQILISDEDNIEDQKEEGGNKRLIRSRQIGDIDDDEHKFNKFINEVIDDKTVRKEIDGCLRDLLLDNLIESGMKREDAAALLKYIIDNDYDTDAIGQDALDCNNGDPFLRYHQSNIMKQHDAIRKQMILISESMNGWKEMLGVNEGREIK